MDESRKIRESEGKDMNKIKAKFILWGNSWKEMPRPRKLLSLSLVVSLILLVLVWGVSFKSSWDEKNTKAISWQLTAGMYLCLWWYQIRENHKDWKFFVEIIERYKKSISEVINLLKEVERQTNGAFSFTVSDDPNLLKKTVNKVNSKKKVVN